MSSIATTVFKATIGLLINKARDTAAEKLEVGDVTDEKFRSLIVREIDQINSKLDGLARKDLLSSISAFKEGIAILFDVFEKANKGVKELKENVTGEAAAEAATSVESAKVSLQSSASAQAEAVSVANTLAKLPLIDLDESSKELLSDAKERFKEARSKARDAFSNEALDTPDRILAMMIRVMATTLEKVDNPANAVTPCKVCLEELHALPAVRKSFSIALAKGWKSWFGIDERNSTIAAVCDINHAIFDITIMVGSNCNRVFWPLIDVGTENVHPLRDPRVAEINLQKSKYIGFYPLQWWLGADILNSAACICTNTKGQFIVGDNLDKNIKVFDCNGNFLYLLSDSLKDTIIDHVATDQADNIYVLCQNKNSLREFQLRIFDKDNNMHRCFVFEFDGIHPSCLSIVEEKSKPDCKKVFVLERRLSTGFVVKVIEISDSYLQGEEFVWYGCCDVRIRSITVCNNGNIMAVSIPDIAFFIGLGELTEVHVFSAEGDFLHKFNVVHETNPLDTVVETIHWANEHLIVVSIPNYSWSSFLSSVRLWDIDVSIYKEDGKLVNHFSIMSDHQFDHIKSITMNRQGRIALVLFSFGSVKKDEILVV